MRYFQRRRKEKLYRQWVERAGLPPETVPAKAESPEDITAQSENLETHEPVRIQAKPDSRAATHPGVTGDMMAEIDRRQLQLPMLYVLLVVCLVILLTGLILWAINAC